MATSTEPPNDVVNNLARSVDDEFCQSDHFNFNLAGALAGAGSRVPRILASFPSIKLHTNIVSRLVQFFESKYKALESSVAT